MYRSGGMMVESLGNLRTELEQLDHEAPASPASRFEALYHQTRSKETQEERRQRLLFEARNRRRDEVLTQKYADVFADQCEGVDGSIEETDSSENRDEGGDRLRSQESPSRSPRKPLARKAEKGSRLMLSEWLLEVPSDFEDSWIVMACPVGKRCSVVAGKGKTCAFSRTGMFMMAGHSSLPGNTGWGPKDGVTVLDCIFDENMKTFFVLDVVFWNGSSLMEQPAEFRFFWLESRLAETEDLEVVFGNDQYPLCLLERHPCTPSELQGFIRSSPQFTTEVDGFIFFHKDGLYLPGTTPLVCWLKPFMIPEVLKVSVPDDLMVRVPEGYVSALDYIAELESKRKNRVKAKSPS